MTSRPPALLLWLFALTAMHGADVRPTVGIEGRLEVQLAGPELAAKPPDRAAPLNVRIASTRPHGTVFQYDLRYIGLVPGKYDLRDYLIRPDGTSPQDLPTLAVEIGKLLPAEHNGQLVGLTESPIQKLGGYKILMWTGASLWVLCAIPILLARRRRREPIDVVADAAPPGIIDQLRPLVELARTGKLTTDGKARIERLLLAHWRERLNLSDAEPAAAVLQLRTHPEAGALLRTLEDWLYRPPGTAAVDLDAALAPYATATEDKPTGTP
jgi:hypothetical protein